MRQALGQNRRSLRRAFTLIEVLVTTLFLAILLPVVVQGIATTNGIGNSARWRTEAAQLAQSKLTEIVNSNLWQDGNSSGDFGPDWPGYRWSTNVEAWPDDQTGAGIQEIDLTVTWTARNRQQSVMLSTLAFARGQQ